MKDAIQYRNDYVYATLCLACLAIVGSLLSIINVIPLVITYELMKKAEIYSNQKIVKISHYLFQTALILTFAISLFYITIQL